MPSLGFVVVLITLLTTERRWCMTYGSPVNSDLETAPSPLASDNSKLQTVNKQFLLHEWPRMRSSSKHQQPEIIDVDDIAYRQIEQEVDDKKSDSVADELSSLKTPSHAYTQAIYELLLKVAAQQQPVVSDAIDLQDLPLGDDNYGSQVQAAKKRQLDVNLGLKGYIKPRVGRSAGQ